MAGHARALERENTPLVITKMLKLNSRVAKAEAVALREAEESPHTLVYWKIA